MKNRLLLLSLAAFAVLLTSCSIEKRVYRDGFYVQRHHKQTVPYHPETMAAQQPASTEASSESSAPSADVAAATTEQQPSDAAVVTPVVLQETATAADQAGCVTVLQDSRPEHDSRVELKQQAGKQTAPPSEGKSQIVAFLLCFFFGLLGIHRFYLGYVGIGLIQLFTLGGFGIWAFIDLIMIAFGALKPKGGEYK
jgi:hypothetical protein